MADLNLLSSNLQQVFAEKVMHLENRLSEVTLELRANDMLPVLMRLRDDAMFRFDQLIDLCGLDYSTYGSDISIGGAYFSSDETAEAKNELPFSSDVTYAAGLLSDEVVQGGVVRKGDVTPPEIRSHQARFAAVYHLLSHTHNMRLRVRVYAEDNGLPVLDSAIGIWPCANWYEREAFDLYGIVFTGHPDLRRLLTDYGFVGNPFRKDFPLSGHVEMRYDPEQQRVIYQPVSIEPREVTPRIVREQNYGHSKTVERK